MRMLPYKAAAWYWVGQPVGQSSPIIYSSAAGAVVPSNNSTYVAWLASGGVATRWPWDDTGAVTTEALDDVLTAAGLPPTGLSALTHAQLLGVANAQIATLMAVPRTYTLSGSPSVSVKCDTLQSTGADLAGLNVWGTASPTATTTWVDDFGVPTVITGAQGVSLGNQVIAYGQSVYDVLGTVAAAIAGGTITTAAQVAAAGWPA
jgi:hypothetical protein